MTKNQEDETYARNMLLYFGLHHTSHIPDSIKTKLMTDEDFLLEASKKYCVINYIPRNSSVYKNDEFLKNIIRNNPLDLTNAPVQLKRDKEFVYEISSKNIAALKYSHDELKDDSEFIISLIKVHYQAIMYASKRLRKDESFIRKAATINKKCFKFSLLKREIEAFEEFIRQDGDIIKYFSDLYDFREMVLVACGSSPTAILYATEKFKDDEEFMKKAIQMIPSNYMHASDRIKSKFEFASLAVKGSGTMIKYVPHEFREKLMLGALTTKPKMLKYAAQKFRENKEIASLAVRNNRYTWRYVSPSLWDDIELQCLGRGFYRNIREVTTKFDIKFSFQ